MRPLLTTNPPPYRPGLPVSVARTAAAAAATATIASAVSKATLNIRLGSNSPYRKGRLIDRLDTVLPEVEGGVEGVVKAVSSTPVEPPAVSVSTQNRRHNHSYSYHHRSASPSPTRDEEDRRQDKERYRLGSMRTSKKKEETEGASGADEQQQEEEGKQGHGDGGEDEGGSQVDDRFRAEQNWEHPTSVNPACKRTLQIEYWDRTRECKERKWDHMDYIDATYASREEWILQSVLHEEDIVLEDNKFPYNTPKGIRHMTLWARRELSLEDVEAFMSGWMEKEGREGGREVRRWNLDENASRSIQIYHVHVYVQEVPDEDVGLNPSTEEEAAAAVAAGAAGNEEAPSADGHEDEHDSSTQRPSFYLDASLKPARAVMLIFACCVCRWAAGMSVQQAFSWVITDTLPLAWQRVIAGSEKSRQATSSLPHPLSQAADESCAPTMTPIDDKQEAAHQSASSSPFVPCHLGAGQKTTTTNKK
ncbi:hypothetical protein VYU27_003912 [Nannochloropsis oceanica]